jgi:ankyrin repeat protein
MESLAQKHTRRAVREALENLPKGLDEMYDNVLGRIYNQDEEDVQLAKKLLSWVSYALRPLTVTELQHALATEPDDRKIDKEAILDASLMLSVCAGIMTIDRESSVIRLVHYTADEYFQRKRQVEFPVGEVSIALTCLTYLSFDAFDAGYAANDEEMDGRLKEFPLLEYAAQNWGTHAGAGTDPNLQSQILNFLTLDSNVSCAVQALLLPSLRDPGYSQSPARRTPALWVAAAFGLTEIVKALLAFNHDLNRKNSRGETALHGAVSAGQEAVVRLLLDKGPDVNAKYRHGYTALKIAAEAGHEGVVRLLLEKGADVNAKYRYGYTALYRAALDGHEGAVRALLEKGADVNARNDDGETALYSTTYAGYEGVVRALLEKGADVNIAPDRWQDTALFRAAMLGHKPIVQLLLGKGANLKAKNKYGLTALNIAAKSERESVVQLLEAHDNATS